METTAGFVLRVVILLFQVVLHSIAQKPGIAIILDGPNEDKLFITENGGSSMVCLVKRSGNITTDGLTVELLFTITQNTVGAEFNSDYTVSNGGTVNFSPGAADGEVHCVNVTALCDGITEGNETITVILSSGIEYQTDTAGSGFSAFLSIEILESAECMSILGPPENLTLRTALSPTVTIEWNAPLSSGRLSYRLTIQGITSYFIEDVTSHSITADGVNVLFNTPYNIEVTAIDAQRHESSPASIEIEIPANAPPTPFINASFKCVYMELSWTYGIPSETVYTPVVDTMVITYRVQSSDESAVACANLSTDNTSCIFTIPQSDNYNITLSLTNIIGTAMASISTNANVSTPLPPKNLTKVPERPSSIIILWEPPENKSAVKYTLKLIETDYSQEHSCSVAKCAYTLTADDDNLMFNTNYTLEVRTVSMCDVESDPKSISFIINSGNDTFIEKTEADSIPAWVWIITVLIIISLVIVVGAVLIWLYFTHWRKKLTGNDMLEMNSTQVPTQANSSGPIYAELEISKTTINTFQHIYQDPDSIHYQAAESGDLYAMPRRKNREKLAENSLYDDTVTVKPKEHPFGLQYAELELPSQPKNSPNKSTDPAYAEIRQ